MFRIIPIPFFFTWIQRFSPRSKIQLTWWRPSERKSGFLYSREVPPYFLNHSIWLHRASSCPLALISTQNFSTVMSQSNLLEPPYGHDHRRASCDELIAQSLEDESDSQPLDDQNLLGRRSVLFPDVDTENSHLHEDMLRSSGNLHRHSDAALKRRAFFIRSLALLCACFLSVGSH